METGGKTKKLTSSFKSKLRIYLSLIMTSFIADLLFYASITITHVPLFLLYAIWFKNARMRYQFKRAKAFTKTGKISLKIELLRQSKTDDIERANEEEEEEEEEDALEHVYPEKPRLPNVFPAVCLQLVIDGRNDSNDQVTEAIDSLCFVHWPRDLLEVHVLDTSSVRTYGLRESNENAAQESAKRWRERGVMCDVFNVSEFEEVGASGMFRQTASNGNLKRMSSSSQKMTDSNGSIDLEIGGNSEQTMTATTTTTKSHKVVSFGNALEKGRLKTRAEIIVPFTKDYLPDPEYLEHIVPSFYTRNGPEASSSKSPLGRVKKGAHSSAYLQTRDLRIACVVPNARFENNNLQTNTLFSVRTRYSNQTSMTTICAELSGCALSNAIPGTAFASSALKTIGGWDTRVNGAVPIADAGMRVWLHGLKVVLPLGSKSAPAASRREVLSVRVPENFAHYCAKMYYTHRNFASLTHKHAINCILDANWVVAESNNRNDTIGMPGIDEDEDESDALKSAGALKANKKFAAFHGLTHQVFSSLLSFWCLLVLPTAFMKEIWFGNALYVGGNVNANILIWIVYILPCFSERFFDLLFAVKMTPPLSGERNRFLTNFVFAFLAHLSTLPSKFAGCIIGLTLPLRTSFRGDKDESTTPFAVALFEILVACTAWWNCVKIMVWTVEETFSEFYFTSVVTLLSIGFAGLISCAAVVNVLKQFSIINHEIKRDGVRAVSKKKMNLKNLKKHLQMRPPKASGEERQGLLESQKHKEEQARKKAILVAQQLKDQRSKAPAEEGVVISPPGKSMDYVEDDMLLQIGGVRSSTTRPDLTSKSLGNTPHLAGRTNTSALGTVNSQPGSVYGREIMHSFQTDGRVYRDPRLQQGGYDNKNKSNAYAPVSDVFAQRAAIKAYKKMRQHDFDLDKHSQADTRSNLSNQSEGYLPSHLRFGSENSHAIEGSQVDLFDENGNYVGNKGGSALGNIDPMFVPKESEYASSSSDDDDDDYEGDQTDSPSSPYKSNRRGVSSYDVRKNSNATDDSAYASAIVNTVGMAMEKSSPPYNDNKMLSHSASRNDAMNSDSDGGGVVLTRGYSSKSLASKRDDANNNNIDALSSPTQQKSPRATFDDFVVQPKLGKLNIKTNGMGRKPPKSPRIQDIDQVYSA
jgi:hypothetical protein